MNKPDTISLTIVPNIIAPIKILFAWHHYECFSEKSDYFAYWKGFFLAWLYENEAGISVKLVDFPAKESVSRYFSYLYGKYSHIKLQQFCVGKHSTDLIEILPIA